MCARVLTWLIALIVPPPTLPPRSQTSCCIQTFLVTAAVTGGDGRSVTDVVRQTYSAKGVKGFYPGGSAIALRQASNWASRQGFTEGFRISWRKRMYGSKDAQLTPNEEVMCGVLGGAVSLCRFLYAFCARCSSDFERRSLTSAACATLVLTLYLHSFSSNYLLPKGLVLEPSVGGLPD